MLVLTHSKCVDRYPHFSFLFLGLCWDTVDMSVSLPYEKLLEIQQLAHSLLKRQPITVHQVMYFLDKTTFRANGQAQLCQLCCVIQSDTLNVYHFPPDLFFHSMFSSNTASPLETVSVAAEFSAFAISSS